MNRIAIGGIALLGACHLSSGMEAEVAPDWASMTRQALAEFETPNGPIVEVVPVVRCEPRRNAPADRSTEDTVHGPPCPGESAGEVLKEFASRLGATLVTNDGDAPDCRWSRSESARPKGLRLEVTVRNVPDHDGRIYLSVGVQCMGDPEDVMRDFAEWAIHPYERVEGLWERRGEVITIIT